MAEKNEPIADREHLPHWLKEVCETACAAFDLGAPGHIGWRTVEEDKSWEAWVYPTRTELVGGRNDGEEVTSGHRSVDLSEILEGFDEPPHVEWCHYTDQIPEVSIEGKVEGHDLWLHILEEAPEDVEPTMRFDVNTGTWEDREPAE